MIHTLGISQAFAGFVIVAIAGNAVENVVGIQLAAKNKADEMIRARDMGPPGSAPSIVPIPRAVRPSAKVSTWIPRSQNADGGQ